MDRKKLPRGIENFADLRTKGYYYADKTMLIKELLCDGALVSLFTRPRRFGKTLNMSMLKSFFETGADKSLFDGLAISREKDLCAAHMGQYPVIFLSLKNIEGSDFESARKRLWNVIREEARRFSYLLEKNTISDFDRDDLQSLIYGKGDLEDSLRLLSGILFHTCGHKVIILIDEYDVPLDKANQFGYYDEMVQLIRLLFGSSLKTNDYLAFAVLTGCLRVSKESIFTGMNNFSVNGITDVAYDEYFGFTDADVFSILQSYDLTDHYDTIREWYDGYHFGNQNIYCPWDVVSYVRSLLYDPLAAPENFWANTSGNEMILRFVNKADLRTKEEIEALIAGGHIRKKLRLDLTYNEIEKTTDHLWSVLFTTGYLTQSGNDANGIYDLSIPNREIVNLFEDQILEWFRHTISDDTSGLTYLCDAFANGDAAGIEGYLNTCLSRSISIRDPQGKSKTENFFHGMLLGMLDSRGYIWRVESNREAGDGYPDIIVSCEPEGVGFIIELKYADNQSMLEESANSALHQILDKNYLSCFNGKTIHQVYGYGIAFYKKAVRF